MCVIARSGHTDRFNYEAILEFCNICSVSDNPTILPPPPKTDLIIWIMSFHLPGPNGKQAQLEFLLKGWLEQKLTRKVFTFRSLVEHFSMWHRGPMERRVTLWSQSGLFENKKQLVETGADAQLHSPFKCSRARRFQYVSVRVAQREETNIKEQLLLCNHECLPSRSLLETINN